MFSLFIRDLSFALDSSPKVQLGQMLINHLLFADDLVLFAHSKATPQQLLDKLSIFATENKLKINLTKSKGMRFGAGICRHVAPLYINGAVLEIVTSYKYLGYMFSSNSNWHLHDYAQALKCHKVVFCINKVLAQFGCVHDLSTHCKLLFSKILPIMAYGTELCGSQPLLLCDRALSRYVKTVLSTRATTSSSVALYEAGLLPFDAYAQEYTL